MIDHSKIDLEAALVCSGGGPEFTLRRRGPTILNHLNRRQRWAVEVYTSAAEAVHAGGVSIGTGASTSGSTASRSEGRQSRAIDQTRFLRGLEASVSGGFGPAGI